MIKDIQNQAKNWFYELQGKICQAFEDIEQENGTPNHFTFTEWKKQRENDQDTGGGRMSLMRGGIFEKVGVNFSEVYGNFAPEFAKEIPGGLESKGAYWACGISLVAHLHNPLVPAVHFNTRMIVTSKSWFGGGGDLNTACPDVAETAKFHGAFKECCDRFNPEYYPKFKAWCDEYFYIKHRKTPRGQGGIFFDNLDSGDKLADFAFTRAVGQCFLDTYPQLVRAKVAMPYTAEQRESLLKYRGLYTEFNLLYDRGTRFGLMTNGNVDAILMSLPPEAKW